MKQLKAISIPIVLLLMLPAAFASTNIISANTTIEIEGNTAKVQSTQHLHTDEPLGNLILIIGKNPTAFKVEINGKEQECQTHAQFAHCGNLTPGDHTIQISYSTSYPFAKVGENTLFRFQNRLSYPSERQRIILKLPVGTIIPREIGKDEAFYISPDTAEIYSDGERIILLWDEQKQEVDLSVIMKNTTPTPTAWIALAGTSTIIAAASIAYILFKRPTRQKKEKTAAKKTIKKGPKTKEPLQKELLPQFIEDERKVVELLQTAPNQEAWQKTILQQTGFSKAKVSRIIRNLEERGVIIKTIYGNTNKVTLKKAIENKPEIKE